MAPHFQLKSILLDLGWQSPDLCLYIGLGFWCWISWGNYDISLGGELWFLLIYTEVFWHRQVQYEYFTQTLRMPSQLSRLL